MVIADNLLLILRDSICAIGVAVICCGALRSLYQLTMLLLFGQFSTSYIRLQFGETVILGLEFTVAGDIVESLVAPDYYNLGLLAIIVTIRTILSYFLSKELQALTPGQLEALK